MINSPNSLSDLVGIKKHFARSANVERDFETDTVEDYLPTARALDVIGRVVEAIAKPSAGRAISITGPYGSGKSSLALFLGALLSSVTDQAYCSAASLLEGADPALALKLAKARAIMGAGAGGFVPAVVTAQREPIAATILRALRAGITRYARGEAAAKAVDAFRVVFEASQSTVSAAAGMRDLVSGVAAVAPILLVIDEFGKSLEQFATLDASAADDLYLLQDLAEWASGEQAIPLIIVTLQHLAFEDYITGASVAHRREWSKVMGRFVDVPYVETAAQSQALIASVFERDARPDLQQCLSAWALKMKAVVEEIGLGSAFHVDPSDCYPLHPVVVAVLPDLCARYGQNERTLFSFLAGSESLSVRSYLEERPLPEAGELPTVRLDRVYDYFLESASTMVGASATASRWLEIETRIRDVQGLDPAERRLLKGIGVLNLVSAGGALRASRRLVTVAAADGQPGTETPESVERLIRALEAKGLVTYRGFADEYRIWSGTDFDLRGAVELARRRLRDKPLAGVLERARPLMPVVAARHSQQTGMLRVFERRYVDRHSRRIEPLPALSAADGLVLLCVDPDGRLPAMAQMADGDKPTIVGIAEQVVPVAEAAQELAAHLDVLNSASDLEGDWVARRELRERAAGASLMLDTALQNAFGPAAQGLRWIRLPGKRELSRGSSLSGALSSLCDERYPDTPRFQNEMLARRVLTSQGAKARRDLLEAMVERGSVETLGLVGYGPERAMYEAVLRSPGIHRPGPGGWVFGPPYRGETNNFTPVWSTIDSFLNSGVDRQIGISEICARLMSPPLGIKEGPLPVLIVAALLARADDVALYESGTFVPRLGPDVIERLAKNPDRFTVKAYAMQGDRGKVVAALAERFGVAARIDGKSRVGSLIAVIAPLLVRAKNLPLYAQQTKRIPRAALAVRQALFEAREPDVLVFHTLPVALGLEPIPAHGTVRPEVFEIYAATLSEAMAELGNLYPALLDQVEASLAVELGVRVESLRTDIRVRSERIAEQILEPQLRSFALALGDAQLDRDEWLEYVGMLVAGKPMASWSDDECSRFNQHAMQLASAFRRVEALHFSQSDLGGDGFEVARVSLTLPDGRDSARVVWVDEAAEGVVTEILDGALSRLAEVIENNGGEMLLAALARRVLLEPAPGSVTHRLDEQTWGKRRHG